MVNLVDQRLVPMVEQGGFRRVQCLLDDPEIPVLGSEIILERPASQGRQFVEFVFEKYRKPRFQIRFGEMRSVGPGIFNRPWFSALVRRPNQGYHFWGKPWWVPTAIWCDADAKRYIAQMVPMMRQILIFFDTRQRGRNVNEPWIRRCSQIGPEIEEGAR